MLGKIQDIASTIIILTLSAFMMFIMVLLFSVVFGIANHNGCKPYLVTVETIDGRKFEFEDVCRPYHIKGFMTVNVNGDKHRFNHDCIESIVLEKINGRNKK